MTASKSSGEMVPQADKQAHTEIAERAGRGKEQPTAAHNKQNANNKQKMRSEDAVPQADKQAHTDIAERAGHQSDKQP